MNVYLNLTHFRCPNSVVYYVFWILIFMMIVIVVPFQAIAKIEAELGHKINPDEDEDEDMDQHNDDEDDLSWSSNIFPHSVVRTKHSWIKMTLPKIIFLFFGSSNDWKHLNLKTVAKLVMYKAVFWLLKSRQLISAVGLIISVNYFKRKIIFYSMQCSNTVILLKPWTYQNFKGINFFRFS